MNIYRINSPCMLGNFPCFCCHLFTFFRKKSLYRNILRVSNRLNPDQDRRYVSPDLDSNVLQRLSADDKSHMAWREFKVYSQSKQNSYIYRKACVKRPLSKRPKIGFQDQLSLNAGKKYYRMLQGAFCNTFLGKKLKGIRLWHSLN